VSLRLGAALRRTATFTDPGADIWTAQVDYGDGSAVETLQFDKSGQVPLEHLYRRAGVYRVTVTVTDDDGGLDTESFAVNVL
jgi:PKD repeat protein